jgi:hypothetical protein
MPPGDLIDSGAIVDRAVSAKGFRDNRNPMAICGVSSQTGR